MLRLVSASLVAAAVSSCSSPPPSSPPAPSNTNSSSTSGGGNYTFDPDPNPSSPNATGSSGLYDASNLASKLGSLLTPPAMDACKSKGIAFIRGTINRCSNVTLENGWCDFSSISAKFEALGTITLSNASAGIPEKSTPSQFFNAAKDKGWLPDQCGTVDAGSGKREPVVFMYRIPSESTGLQIMPVCLKLLDGAPKQFVDQNTCEI